MIRASTQYSDVFWALIDFLRQHTARDPDSVSAVELLRWLEAQGLAEQRNVPAPLKRKRRTKAEMLAERDAYLKTKF
jgi:hypothetical protein